MKQRPFCSLRLALFCAVCAAFAANAADSTINATDGVTATDEQKNLLQDGADGGTVTVKGSGNNGLTVTLDNKKTLTTHIVFDGGVHNLTSINDGGYTVCTNSSLDNPMWLVKSGTTLNFTGRDFGGWGGDTLDKCVIAIENGGTINLADNGSNTFYVRNRWILNPGATLNVNTSGDKFRVYGGTTSGKEQFYVPDGNGTATISGSGMIRLPGESTKGVAAFVGAGSTLALNVELNSENATDRPFVKRGAGTIEFNGNIANLKSDVTIEDGMVRIGATPFGGKVTVESGATLAFNPNGGAVTCASEVAVSGNIVVDDSSAAGTGTVKLDAVSGSGTFSVLNGVLYLPVGHELTAAEGTVKDAQGSTSAYEKYVKAGYVAQPVAKVGETEFYSVEAAVNSLNGAAGTITLLADAAAEGVTLAVGQKLVLGGYTIGTVAAANGAVVGLVGGVYTAYVNTTAEEWTGNGTDNKWKNAANWSLGFVPLKTTQVTIPAVGATISIASHDQTETCASLVLNGNLTLTYASPTKDGGWPVLYFYESGVSGSGTLTLNRACLNNQTTSEQTISVSLVVANDSRGDSSLLGASDRSGWKVSGGLTVQNGGYLIVRDHALNVTGPTTIEKGAKLGPVAAMTFGGTTTFKGDFERTNDGNSGLVFGDVVVAGSTTIPGDSSITLNGRVTIADGQTLTIPTSATIGASAEFVLAGASAKLVVNGVDIAATAVQSGIAGVGVEIAKDGTTTTYSIQATIDATFDWAPGQNPTGWITSWTGENGNNTKTVIGPSGTADAIYVTSVNPVWTPWNSGAAAMTDFTFLAYGSTDMVKAPAGKIAPLWCMGGNSQQKTALVKDEEGNIKLVQVSPSGNGNNITKTINAGKVKGYRLFTMRFSTTTGASLQIDDGEVYSDATFTQVSGNGLQVGSVLEGAHGPFERVGGFAVLKMLAYPTASISDTQYANLCATYPAVETIDKTIVFDKQDGTLYLPSLTIPDGKQFRVQSGTLVVPAGVEATLAALELGDKKDAVFGLELDGTINIVNNNTVTGNDYKAVYDACNAGRGVDFGEWDSTGTVNIRGVFNAPNDVVELSHDAFTTITIDGGTFIARGITARYDDRATLILKGGGTLNLGQYPSAVASIVKEYGYGTVTGTENWTDTDEITLTDADNGTTFRADGVRLEFKDVTSKGARHIEAVNGGEVVFHDRLRINGIVYSNIEGAIDTLTAEGTAAEGAVIEVLDESVRIEVGIISWDDKTLNLADYGFVLTENEEGSGWTASLVYATAEDGAVLRISEIMPKPTDAQNRGALEGMDVNGLESGWVELENTSDKWANLAHYRFTRTNRSKKSDQAAYGNFPDFYIAPHSRAIFYTSERYSNSADMTVSAFAEADANGVKPKIYGPELGNILVWPDKVNPKKYPYVRLYYAPDGVADEDMQVVDTVVIPSDIPEGCSIIVGDAADGEGMRRWLCPTPTRGTANTSTDALVRLGPNVGPLYEKKDQKKTDVVSEFDRISPPAIPGEDYVITLPVNGVMNPDGTFTPRTADQIAGIKLVYRRDLDDTTLATNEVDLSVKSTDANWGDQYTVTIPSSFFPERGHLIQWKVLITDGEGTEWTSPSFNNPDDGYEWYGTIVEPDASTQMSATLPTWHMFADSASLAQMDVDADTQNRNVVPNQARVAIYDSTTSNYYDYVRIDLRGNTSAKFTKKSHGLRFAKSHPLTMKDIVSGEKVEEIRKTSLISEFADPSKMRQMIAFWLWRKMGNNVPFDFPVRCNMNGEFYQLAFNSERFTDELIEDVYGLDKYGYGYKNVGTLKSGTGTTAGGIEKKTPDDEDEGNITVLQSELRAKITAAQQVSYSPDGGDVGLDNAALTKFVVEKFNLPAWLNYLASARITQECDDVWANVCVYYDNAEMHPLGGVRGTDTWMPLGYDFNLSFGQYHAGDIGHSWPGLISTNDWHKSHPFYGGNRVRAHNNAQLGDRRDGNDGFEAVWQSAKFRRLYLRRLRTLMDQELKAPGTAEDEVPFMAKMREMAELMSADAERDNEWWPNDNSDDANDVWTGKIDRPATIEAGIDEIWNDYVVPRREHLYVTHSVTNTAKTVGYGTYLNAGIPEAQSPIADLIAGFSIDNLADAEGTAIEDSEKVVIRNANAEAVDMSGWKLSGRFNMTLPAGTVVDANDVITIVADRRAYIAANEATLTDDVIVGNAKLNEKVTTLKLTDANDVKVLLIAPPTNEQLYLRLHSFDGVTPMPEGDTGEWIVLTNISDSVTLDLKGVNVVFLKDGEEVAKCNITIASGKILPGGSFKLNQSDYSKATGWDKITNNKLIITISDANGIAAQEGKVTQKNYEDYYGDGGPGGYCYIRLTQFGPSFKSGDFEQVVYPEIPVEAISGDGMSISTISESMAKEIARTMTVTIPADVAAASSVDVDAATYDGYFAKSIAPSADGKKWVVTATLNPAAVLPEAESEDEATMLSNLVKLALGNSETTAAVPTKAGLYYWICGATSVDAEKYVDGEMVLGDGGARQLKRPVIPGENGAAFFKVCVGVQTPADAANAGE